ncbi:MAG TPA: alpha/beta fold hydrolase [Anaerolineales bacterium]|nr:alpha/beta fold hydrolase [Anaerolineales bacterium]
MRIDVELYRRRVGLDGGRHSLSAIDIAPENSRRTLVFLHGFGGNARQWVYQLIHFSERDRVIALDLRGHGESSRPDGPYDVATLVKDLEQALPALDLSGRFVLVGHSFGSALAVEYALRHPERIEGLVLISASSEFPLAWHLRWALRLPVFLLNLAYPFIPSLKAPPRVLKRFHREALSIWRGWDKFAQLEPPTLVLRGHRDRVFARAYFEKVAQAIPRAEDVNVGASGHMVMLERRDAVNRAIERFLGAGRRSSWRDERRDHKLLRDRPWLASYDEGVPFTIAVPPIRVDDFLASAARRFPLRPAIHFYGLHMTYRRLEGEANRFARALIDAGVQPGDRVLLLLPNLPQLPVCFFGTLRAGAVAAFATPLSEPDELLRQIRDSGAAVLVTLSQHADLAARAMRETGLRRVILTSIWEYLPWGQAMALRLRTRGQMDPPRRLPPGFSLYSRLLYTRSHKPPEALAGPDAVAVLQYTGGTTAEPKGVMLSHRNLVANALQTRHWLPDVREGGEVILSVLPFSHIYGLMTALIIPVTMAGSMVILPTFVTQDVLQAVRRHRPTLFPGVPTMYTAINDFPGVRHYGVGSIRACISGAAPLPVEVQEAFERLTRGRLVEGYGLTEAGPVTHANPFTGMRKVGSIGVPLPSTEAKIVDLSRGHDLPPGKIGELAVRGPQVMQGYWNHPKTTRETITRSGWLLTGDLARQDADGYFQIIARKKEMILAGRYQVYPRDIEEVLYEHPKVREAAVVGVQAPRWPWQKVKAYVVLRKGEEASETELIALCRRRLESYAVPWKIEFVDDLPKSFVGKVLRRVLIERSEADLQIPEATDRRRGRPVRRQT